MKANETKAVVKTDNAVPSPANLLQLAVEKDVDVDKLEKLMAMQERWNEQQAKKEYYASLSKFQAECPPILKTKAGYDKRYYFAPLDQIISVIKKPMFDSGLTYRWEQENKDKLIIITCIITHVAGHSEKTTLEDVADTSGSKNAIQAMGSTVQYLRRYTLESVLGIATSSTDVDGQQPKEKTAKLTKEASNELLIKAKIVIDEYDEAKYLQKDGRAILEQEAKNGLNDKDKKELTAHITMKYEQLKNPQNETA